MKCILAHPFSIQHRGSGPCGGPTDTSPLSIPAPAPGQELRDGLVFCFVESWLTGRRLVSLPFSDHCEPLASGCEGAQALLASLRELCHKQNCRYAEVRSLEHLKEGSQEFQEAETYYLHCVDLVPDLGILYRNLHKSSTQRKIRRAEREGLIYQEGQSEALLEDFYKLLRCARQRHGVSPQSRAWFRNLMQCFGESLKIRLAYREKRPIAAMITLRYKDTLVYKYGGL